MASFDPQDGGPVIEGLVSRHPPYFNVRLSDADSARVQASVRQSAEVYGPHRVEQQQSNEPPFWATLRLEDFAVDISERINAGPAKNTGYMFAGQNDKVTTNPRSNK